MGKKNRGGRNSNKKNKKKSSKAARSTPVVSTSITQQEPAASLTQTTVDNDANPSQSSDEEKSNATLKPKVKPGQLAVVCNLKSRTDLNGCFVKIEKKLQGGRVAVELTHYWDRNDFGRKERISIKEENLMIQTTVREATSAEICDICFDTQMDPTCSKRYACCGKEVCHTCCIKMKNSNRCPYCNTQVATKKAVVVDQIRARADRGNSEAMNELGKLYQYGKTGLPMDGAAARMWYERAARKNHPHASHNLAECYLKGLGGPENFEEGARWLQLASDLGVVNATTTLGVMYMQGTGVKRDLNKAKQLLKKSTDAGDETAKEFYEKISFITPEMMPMMEQVVDILLSNKK